MKKFIALSGAALIALCHGTAWSAEAAAADAPRTDEDSIVVTAATTGSKTDTALVELPQPIKVITSEQYLSQGAISISDTVKYAAGVLANPYGRDTRVDGFNVRGLDALQFRDGMRDIFSYYASITSDPYNFSRVEILRGPASVLFGQGSIGGLVNLVSKTPDFTTRGELNLVYGSYDRKEAMGDVNVALADNLAVRFVGRVRDADTYVDHVPDDRVMFAPSIRWQPTPDTDIVLTGLYQEDDTGSTSQFLPIVGTFMPNNVAGEQLDRYTFVGKAGWDRYDGRSLQGGGSITHRFSDNVKLSLKARYIDSDLEYNTHYADSYTNPQDPFSVYGTDGRTIALTADASDARMNVFSTDNNVQFNFNTGANIEHKLLVGIDYSWNKVSKRYAGGYELVDLYDIDYDALATYDPTGPFTSDSQKQLGVYVQDQIRFYDRVSVVLGARRDRVTGSSGQKDNATTFRAGIIGEIGAGISPFFSYTESFLPVAGRIDNGDGSYGDAYKPQTGTQYEAGVKWQPAPSTLVTATVFKIKERNRVLYLAAGGTEQSGVLNTKGFEIEASHTLPGNFELLANYGYSKLKSETNTSLDYMPRHTASLWSTKTFGLADEAQLRLGGGVVYSGKSVSTSAIWSIVTPSRTTVDALAEITWQDWRFALNATNLLNKKFYASCLARGDCFMGAPRNVMGTVGFRF
ncbi:MULTISPECIES: TonB-dependent siderophore receptor [Sphingobium]|jgi:iron complex outermembrane receptor protein|uniref:TonB-dependent siderophore receptor n=4 Tax=Sphingobium yanoikuyae TaxID=13690 RepID=K9CUX8_SPHYA|nr:MULTISPECIES: TonB-dependent siderophore receptor [Sphingobium]RSU79467.1 TonB-dependent siderophore receptor [Sphingomonas sp. S-NIH.Pt3_0716]ATI81615.1 TonB-dependent siderophore receptor [Sphingobium yanoikuyae]ATP18332.1 TonB-dependent siderophore receptor [Sphingobium yanoikuyae]EKU76034.1 TonB-dependent siderophore receptor [Sphingobium yanoikuyae ATCC 51230]KMW31264.1 ferrisiderophore receptor [Sphingobium yanoikuyae]